MDRRDFFKFAGGSVVGLALTPVPWTLLNSTSKWSQNWSWIPRPPKGEIRTKFTTCTLCPAGCGVRARCVGDQPVSLAGVVAHPASHGKLCPIGLAAHQQPYHPARLRGPLHRGKPVTMEEAVAGVRAAIDGAKGPVVILDPRPGRAASAIYQRFAASLPNGVYLPLPPAESGTIAAIEKLSGKPGRIGLDWENARIVVSFGAPVLDGWGVPGRVHKNREHFRLIQIEPVQSRTAALADLWLPIHPGTEEVLARGLAQEPGYTPESVARICGVTAQQVEEIARELIAQGPAIAVGDADPKTQLAIARLNLLSGGVIRRSGAASVEPPAGLAPASVLLVDGEPPWRWVQPLLAPKAVVVSLSPWNNARSEFVIPSPVMIESLADVPEPCDARAAMLSLAAPLVSPPAGAISPAAFLQRLEPSIGSEDEEISRRVAAVHRTRRGEVISYRDGSVKPLPEIASAEDLQKLLLAGAVWVDKGVSEAPASGQPILGNGRLPTLTPHAPAYGWHAVRALSVSPILSKLYQESGLRDPREA